MRRPLVLENCGCRSVAAPFAPAARYQTLPHGSASVARAYKWRQDRKFLRKLKRDTAARRKRMEATPPLDGSGGGGGRPSTRRERGGAGSGGAGAAVPSAARPLATADGDTVNRAFPGSGEAPRLSGVDGGEDGSQKRLAAAAMGSRRDGEISGASDAGGSSSSSSSDEPRGESAPAGQSSIDVGVDVDLRGGLT